MIPKSLLYKLVKDGKIIAEGSKKDMKDLKKKTPESFVGLGSPAPQNGQVWK